MVTFFHREVDVGVAAGAAWRPARGDRKRSRNHSTLRWWRRSPGLGRRVESVGPLTRRARTVVGEAPGDRDSMGDLRQIRETRLTHERRNAVSEVVTQALASLVQTSEKTVGSRRRSSEVKQVQGASGFEYPPCLIQRLLFLLRPEVVEHQGG